MEALYTLWILVQIGVVIGFIWGIAYLMKKATIDIFNYIVCFIADVINYVINLFKGQPTQLADQSTNQPTNKKD